MQTDIKLAQVIIDARDQNDWHVIGAISLRYNAGVRPNGVIAFTRPEIAALNRVRDWPQVPICGTARFYVREDGETVFHTGAYDLSRDDAMADLVKRGAATPLSPPCRHDMIS